jgi:hypothetical protein
MLKRLWLLLAFAWAACVLVPQAFAEEGLSGKTFVIALAPLVIGLVLERASHFVVAGK